jgi:hypothetical protein
MQQDNSRMFPAGMPTGVDPTIVASTEQHKHINDTISTIDTQQRYRQRFGQNGGHSTAPFPAGLPTGLDLSAFHEAAQHRVQNDLLSSAGHYQGCKSEAHLGKLAWQTKAGTPCQTEQVASLMLHSASTSSQNEFHADPVGTKVPTGIKVSNFQHPIFAANASQHGSHGHTNTAPGPRGEMAFFLREGRRDKFPEARLGGVSYDTPDHAHLRKDTFQALGPRGQPAFFLKPPAQPTANKVSQERGSLSVGGLAPTAAAAHVQHALSATGHPAFITGPGVSRLRVGRDAAGENWLARHDELTRSVVQHR